MAENTIDSAAGQRVPSGIGGWLILPAIGLVLGPILIAIGMSEVVSVLPDLPSGTMIQVFVWGEAIANIALIGFFVKVAFDFFRQRRVAPANYIALLVTSLAVQVADVGLAAALFGAPIVAEDIRALARPILASAIWIPYFKRSRRVANTFVRD